MDRIIINDLHIYSYHGVHDSEKETGQNFYVSAVLYTDLYTPGHTDRLEDTVSYSDASKLIYKLFNAEKYDLIEKAAYRLAEAILDEYPSIEKAEITVRKPEAPIGLEIGDVAVSVTAAWHTAYIGIGSNMGDRQGYIDKGVELLSASRGIAVEKVSSIIETPPYGGVEQDDFLNGVLKIRTYLPPYALLDRLNDIEDICGRVRIVHWGPRTLDLDILLYDDLKMDEEKLTIPHPDMMNREFVLKPLREIAPGIV